MKPNSQCCALIAFSVAVAISILLATGVHAANDSNATQTGHDRRRQAAGRGGKTIDLWPTHPGSLVGGKNCTTEAEFYAEVVRRDAARREYLRRQAGGDSVDSTTAVDGVVGGERRTAGKSLHETTVFGGRQWTEEEGNLNEYGNDVGSGRASALTESLKKEAEITKTAAKSGRSYYVKVGVGSPPQEEHLLIDTGSDLTWMQSTLCRSYKCYDQTDPLFDFSRSTTYTHLHCNLYVCTSLPPNRHDCTKEKICRWLSPYVDGSWVAGILGSDRLTVGDTSDGKPPLVLPYVTVGAAYQIISESIAETKAAGILGLGRNMQSVAHQLDSFTYCLPSVLKSPAPGYLRLDGDVPEGKDTVIFSLTENPFRAGFYYVPLTGIYVNGEPVEGIQASAFDIAKNGEGGMMMDSGTIVSYLPRTVLRRFQSALIPAISSYQRVVVQSEEFNLCYHFRGGLAATSGLPDVDLQFRGGARLALQKNNLFISFNGDYYCLAFLAVPDGKHGLLGSITQEGFELTYNRDDSKLHVVPKSC